MIPKPKIETISNSDLSEYKAVSFMINKVSY